MILEAQIIVGLVGSCFLVGGAALVGFWRERRSR